MESLVQVLATNYYDAWIRLKDAEVQYEWDTAGMDWGTSNSASRMPRELELQRLRNRCEEARLKLFVEIADTCS